MNIDRSVKQLQFILLNKNNKTNQLNKLGLLLKKVLQSIGIIEFAL